MLGVLYVLVFPSLKNFSTHTEAQIIRSQLMRAIRLAQNEAMLRQENIFLEKKYMNWLDGYVVRSERIQIYSFDGHDNRGVLHWKAFPAHQQHLQFTRTGMMHAENGSFWYCENKNTKPSWAVVVNKAGRAREVLPDKWGELENDKSLVCFLPSF